MPFEHIGSNDLALTNKFLGKGRTRRRLGSPRSREKGTEPGAAFRVCACRDPKLHDGAEVRVHSVSL